MASDPAHETPSIPLFLHGLDSSIQGTKAQWFGRHFPRVRLQNYTGDLDERLAQLEEQVAGLDRLVLAVIEGAPIVFHATPFGQALADRGARILLLGDGCDTGQSGGRTAMLGLPFTTGALVAALRRALA